MITRKDIQDFPVAYPVKVKDPSGKVLNGRIAGVQNDFPIVCVYLCGIDAHFEFSWAAILKHLNNETNKQTYLIL